MRTSVTTTYTTHLRLGGYLYPFSFIATPLQRIPTMILFTLLFVFNAIIHENLSTITFFFILNTATSPLFFCSLFLHSLFILHLFIIFSFSFSSAAPIYHLSPTLIFNDLSRIFCLWNSAIPSIPERISCILTNLAIYLNCYI